MRWSDTYVDYLAGRQLDPKTIAIYRQKVDQAERWARTHHYLLRNLSTSQTRQMAEELWPLAHSSRRQARSALKYFWEMQERPDPPHRAIPVPKKPRGRNRATSKMHARALVRVAMGWYPQGVAVLCGLYMALRASEIGAMRWDRFDPDLSWYTVLGKGSVTATIPVHSALRPELVDCRTGCLFLFPGSRGRAHVSGTTVLNWTIEVAKTAGIEGITPHILRHTSLTEMNDRTGDLRATQQFARHARPETTALYTRVDSERLEAAVETINYLE